MEGIPAEVRSRSGDFFTFAGFAAGAQLFQFFEFLEEEGRFCRASLTSPSTV